jgi:hypothetical protein
MGTVARWVAVSSLVLMGLGAAVSAAVSVSGAVGDGGDSGVRQYLVPADVTQEDAGTCWVEVRDSGAGHLVCFTPGEDSRFRPYVRESVTDGNETWAVR